MIVSSICHENKITYGYTTAVELSIRTVIKI